VRRVLAAEAFDDAAFDAFQADRLEFKNLGDMVGGDEGVFEAEYDKRAMWRVLYQADLGFENDNTCTFAADE
jgi:putative component of toxin-antitoxin plasmid stabilization module